MDKQRITKTIQIKYIGDLYIDRVEFSPYAIIIFRKIGNHVLDDVVDFYICYSFEKGIIIQRHNLHCGSIDNVFFKPATKEQRDLLFKKMHEAGYEWDAKKKELRKIDARENLTLDGDLMQADCMIVEQKPAMNEAEHKS